MATIKSEAITSELTINNNQLEIAINDTSGIDNKRSLISNFYKTANVVILVYDITSRESFEKLTNYYSDLSYFNSNNDLIVIVGNKVDLIDDSTEKGNLSFLNKKQFGIEEFQCLMQKNGQMTKE